MDIIYIISAILSLIILICFFKMGINLGAIRREIEQLQNANQINIREERRLSYHTNRTLGYNKAAAEDLTSIMMLDLIANMTDVERVAKYEELKTKHEKRFADLGYPFPPYSF